MKDIPGSTQYSVDESHCSSSTSQVDIRTEESKLEFSQVRILFAKKKKRWALLTLDLFPWYTSCFYAILLCFDRICYLFSAQTLSGT